ncbi:MAG: PAS domain S-box protein [Nevskia sp.]|nr:PAS domain S-box protein [Nevskia sp.]
MLNEPSYKLLFESSPHPYLVLLPDAAFTIVAVDDRYLTVTGTQRDSITGRGLFDVFPDSPANDTATGVSDLKMSLDRVVREKVQDVMGVQKYDIPSPEKDGTFETRYWSPVNTPVIDGNGLVVMIIHHVEDITEFVLMRERVSHDASEGLGMPQPHAYRLEAEVLRRAAEQKDANRQLKAMMEGARQTEAALQQSEEQFRSSFENAAIGMALVAIDGRWLQVNQALTNMLGYSREELSSLTLQDITYPDDLATDLDFVREMLAGQRKSYQMEKRYLRKNGDLVWALLAVSLLRDDSGSPVHFISQIQDITALKQAQAAVATSEKEFRLLAEAMPQIVWITRADGWNIYFNHQWVEYTGLTLEESYGDGWNKPFHPDDQQRAWEAWQNAVHNNGAYSLECRLRRADGEYRWWLVRGAPVLNEKGAIEKWFGTCTDIHDLKEATESLRLSALVYEASSESMIVTDPDGIILAVNPAFTVCTGYTREEAIGQPISLLKSGRQGDDFYKTMWAKINADGHWDGEIWDRRKNGEAYLSKVIINTVYSDDGSIFRRVALASDITEQKKALDTIWQQANFDPLTGLPNRRMFIDRLGQEIKKNHRTNTRLALMFIDLDMFKEVNDSLGHEMGDLLLKIVASRLVDCVREVDVVARLGGDEFTLMMGELENTNSIDRVAATIIEKLAAPYRLKDTQAYISASIGITIYPDDATGTEDLLKCADQAMYESKRLGRNRFNYFKPSMQAASLRKMGIAGDLRRALLENQFRVYYQPIVDLGNGTINKAEALLRWQHPSRGLLTPAEFIPIAEGTGLIISIGEWVFREAAAQAAAWKTLKTGAIQISINKSPVQFREKLSSPAIWLKYLTSLGLKGDSEVVEITEGMLLGSDDFAKTKLLEFRDAGIQVALDDFGTGYSSLSYLKKFDIDYIKIDQSFISGLESDSNGLVLCEAIIVMAHKLGLITIAEGIETEQQRALLTKMGCDYGQGFLFSRPVPAKEFEDLLERSTPFQDQMPCR